jgi:hypothetical protein
MSLSENGLRAGDRVQVLSLDAIRSTLDESGCLDGLPFMPEMVAYCGTRQTVKQTVEKLCADCSPSTMRQFSRPDVVVLDGLRCNGGFHDGCGRACTLFWRSPWLRKVDQGQKCCTESDACSGAYEEDFATRMKTRNGDGLYFCQSTELLRVTDSLSRSQRVSVCGRDLIRGNRSPLEMAFLMVLPLVQKCLRKFPGYAPRGNLRRTPSGSLNLQPGEWIEVRPKTEILATLDEKGCNRGLRFSDVLYRFCGKRYRVRSRVDQIILEGHGKMLAMKNTVTLEGVDCVCSGVAFGGCPRGEVAYWREIWLRRVEGPKG